MPWFVAIFIFLLTLFCIALAYYSVFWLMLWSDVEYDESDEKKLIIPLIFWALTVIVPSFGGEKWLGAQIPGLLFWGYYLTVKISRYRNGRANRSLTFAGVFQSFITGLFALAGKLIAKFTPRKPHAKLIVQIENDANGIEVKAASDLLLSICHLADKIVSRGNFNESIYLLDLQNLAAAATNLRSMSKNKQHETFIEIEAKLRQFEQKLRHDLEKPERALQAETRQRIDFLSSTAVIEDITTIKLSPHKQLHH